MLQKNELWNIFMLKNLKGITVFIFLIILL
jgi:hypothetical protein